MKLKDQKSIPVPQTAFARPTKKARTVAAGDGNGSDSDDDDNLGSDLGMDVDDEIMGLGEEEGLDGEFLTNLDETGIRR